MRDNSKAARERRRSSAAERLAASKPCHIKGCTSAHVDWTVAHPKEGS